MLHVHSPVTPSLSMVACWSSIGPIVATFHASMGGRSRSMSASAWVLQVTLEKVRARIAVSEEARRTVVQNLGGDAILIPNGVDVARFINAKPLDGWPVDGGVDGLLGRVDEPRKGLPELLAAFPTIAERHPGVRLLVIGPGDPAVIDDVLPAALRPQVEVLGGSTKRPKRGRSRRLISTLPHTSVVKASASCCWKRWRRTLPSWPVTFPHFARCLTTVPAERCSRWVIGRACR